MDRAPPEARGYDFKHHLQERDLVLSPSSVEILQVNITRLCNQACVHCHVDASPRRREMMTDAVLDRCLEILRGYPSIKTLDITGGAPELHPRFRNLVTEARGLGKRVIVRHNLSVTLDPHPLTKESMAYLPSFFAANGVEVISSLPCYQQERTDRQRGDGVFEKSIQSLLLLNTQGYGKPHTDLILNLVYNPVGAFLPPAQETLERTYKLELAAKFGIEFNHLLAITNMPIHRFKAQLVRLKSYEDYMQTLVAAFSAEAAQGVMCRSLLSVAWDGTLYDCDFNQMLGMAIRLQEKPMTIFDFNEQSLKTREIQFGSHCFGCTAGAGSSCLGNTTATSPT